MPRLGIRTRLRRAAGWVADTRHRSGAARLAGDSPEYREYLDVQLRRTLAKRGNDPGAGARLLVGRVVEAGALGPASSVLCVGCRNGIELDEFRRHGVGNVVGIDLFSQRDDILVMDMHAMTFEDARFDAVYSSHALEHSFDVERVVGEIRRVAKPGAVIGVEVPLGTPRSTADRVAFGALDDLRGVVAPILAGEVWAEEQPPGSATNEQGTAVARLVGRTQA